jgi:hypothetical protein
MKGVTEEFRIHSIDTASACSLGTSIGDDPQEGYQRLFGWCAMSLSVVFRIKLFIA